VKRIKLLRHLRVQDCVLKREGRSHSLWVNPTTGMMETIPRHNGEWSEEGAWPDASVESLFED